MTTVEADPDVAVDHRPWMRAVAKLKLYLVGDLLVVTVDGREHTVVVIRALHFPTVEASYDWKTLRLAVRPADRGTPHPWRVTVDAIATGEMTVDTKSRGFAKAQDRDANFVTATEFLITLFAEAPCAACGGGYNEHRATLDTFATWHATCHRPERNG